MRDQKIQTLVLTALMTALCAVMTMVIKIPSPMGGYFNLGDCAVLLSAWLLGPVWGAAAAAAGLLGLAVIDHHAHARGMRRGPRVLLTVGAFALAKLLHLDLALAGVGLLDELLGLRGQKKIKFPPQGRDDGEDDLDP